jgi:hypothetical protein
MFGLTFAKSQDKYIGTTADNGLSDILDFLTIDRGQSNP